MRLRILLPVLGVLGSVVSAAESPNVVIFLADDQGWGDLAVNGNADLRTPRIDSLAEQGARFERFFVCPVCAPTRAEFLTGRHSARTGVRGVSMGRERMNADELTIAQVFKAGGYATGAFGKWHNGSQAPYHPNSRGFDEFYGFTSGHWGHYFSPELDHNGEVVKGEGFLADDFTNKAISFIEQHKDEPFFCYIPYCTPHSPMQVPDSFWKRFKNQPLAQAAPPVGKTDHFRAALAMVENLDWNVGRVLARLDELGLTKSTIVIYFSDNGPNGARWNGGMRGVKGSLYDGGTRSPFFIRWPGRIGAGTRVERNAGAIDLLPTLAALAGLEFEAPKRLDGRDVSPLLLGGEEEWEDRNFYSTQGRGENVRWAVRNQQYRFYSTGELHDITVDPEQQENIAAGYPEIVAKMKALGQGYLREVRPVLREPDARPNPLGVAETTQLPARDGTGHGGVKWSSIHPNCSFFSAWNSVDQKMTWPVEVAGAGRYEVAVHYTCGRGDVGSVIELSCGEAAVTAKIARAFDPPLLGETQDRSPRTESYYKDFMPLEMGVITLGEGPAELTLRALEVAGGSVADVRRLVLRRLP